MWSKEIDGTQDLVLLKQQGLSGLDGYGDRGPSLWPFGKTLTAARRSQLSSPGAARHWRWRLWIVEMDSCDTAYLDGDNSVSIELVTLQARKDGDGLIEDLSKQRHRYGTAGRPTMTTTLSYIRKSNHRSYSPGEVCSWR